MGQTPPPSGSGSSSLASSTSYLGVGLSHIDGPVSALIVGLSQNPTVSFNPLFNVLLIWGFVTAFYEMAELTVKGLSIENGFWRIGSAALSGLVLVTWAKYVSPEATWTMLGAVIAMAIFVALYRHKEILQYATKWRVFIILGLFFAAGSPAFAVRDVVGKPQVIVSPGTTFVTLDKPGSVSAINGTIGSTSASSSGFNMIGRARGAAVGLLTVYINNTLGGPLQIPFLEKGRQVAMALRFQSSPQIGNGTYTVDLNYTYNDFFRNAYSGTVPITIFVGRTTGGGFAAPVLPLEAIEGIVAVGGFAIGTFWIARANRRRIMKRAS